MKVRIAILVGFAACLLGAQARLTFEAAAIHPSSADQSHAELGFSGGRFSVENCTLSFIIQQAYDLRDFQVVGGPGWIVDGGGARFDIQAKAEATASEKQVKLMAQTLLADRFRLKAHRETRPVPVYALVLAKGGSKLQPPKPGERRGVESYPGFIGATNAPMTAFVEELSGKVDRPVIEKTGLSDRYDLTLRWTPDVPGHADPGLGSIFTAIREQLGLQLEPRKEPTEILVIDSIERPTPN